MNKSTKPLEPPDSFHLSGAIGWLELGNHFEANDCRKIVLRLIEAGELPKTAQKQFDLTFPSNTIENHQ